MTQGSTLRAFARPAVPLSAILLAGMIGAGRADAQELRTVSYSRQVTDEDHIEVEVLYGIGELTIRRSDPGVLYRARMRYHERFATPIAEYDSGLLKFGMEIVEGEDLEAPWEASSETPSTDFELPSMDLELPADVAMDLNLVFLGGTVDLDLTGMPIRNLELTNGGSESEIRITEPNPVPMRSAEINVGVADFTMVGLGNLNAREVDVTAGLGDLTLGIDGVWPEGSLLSIGMGVGALRIHIPESLGVRVEHESTFLTSLHADGFVKVDDTYTSENWDDARRRLEIDLSATLGVVEFVWRP